jgi:hypothetical protein
VASWLAPFRHDLTFVLTPPQEEKPCGVCGPAKKERGG